MIMPPRWVHLFDSGKVGPTHMDQIFPMQRGETFGVVDVSSNVFRVDSTMKVEPPIAPYLDVAVSSDGLYSEFQQHFD